EQTLFPCVIYRVQIANSEWPDSSGSLIQCSPMMDATSLAMENAGNGEVHLHDPFLRFDESNGALRIMVSDTQPVLANARYAYFVVRFNEFGEIADVIELPPVDIP